MTLVTVALVVGGSNVEVRVTNRVCKSQRRGLEGVDLKGEHFGAVDQKKRERQGRGEDKI